MIHKMPKIGDKIVLKPLHICEWYLSEKVPVVRNMERFWTYPFLTVKSFQEYPQVFKVPIVMVEEDICGNYKFDVEWIHRIIPKSILPDDLFTLED